MKNFVYIYSDNVMCTEFFFLFMEDIMQVVRKFFLSAVIVVMALSLHAEATDSILARIQGYDVTKEMFEDYCRRHASLRHPESSGKCLERFIEFKLKTLAAKANGWDTLPTFRQQCKVLQGEILKSYFVDRKRLDARCRDLYKVSSRRLAMNDWVKFDQITFRLSQHASKEEEYAAKFHMDSVYKALQQGADFHVMSKPVTGWYPLVGLLKEFAEELSLLPVGGYSAPFFSPFGMHIVRLADRKRGLSYEEAKPYLEAYIERLDAPSFLREEYYDEWLEGGFGSKEMTVALEEVEEQLLADSWDAMYGVPSDVQVDDRVLEDYFGKHRKEYRWEFPHYKGAVIRCPDRKIAKDIKRRLKKVPMSDWEETFETYLQQYPSVKADIQVGLFQIGTNAYVDKLAFKCGSLPSGATLQYAFVLGRRLKKGPEDFRDVYEEVLDDYQNEQRKSEYEELCRRFPVEINQEVLKTVNCGGSN